MADLDEISAAIGEMRADIRSNRILQNERHQETKDRLAGIEVNVGTIATKVADLATDRKVAIFGISAITGIAMYLGGFLVTPILKKLGFQ